jgi:hypothetical protein
MLSNHFGLISGRFFSACVVTRSYTLRASEKTYGPVYVCLSHFSQERGNSLDPELLLEHIVAAT